MLLQWVRGGARCSRLHPDDIQAASDAGGVAAAGESLSCLFGASQELSISVGMDEKNYVFGFQSSALALRLAKRVELR